MGTPESETRDRCVAAVLAVLLTLTRLSAQPPEAGGTLSGCIADIVGQPLPGVTIDVSADGIRRTIFSGSAGCYELANLPRGAYVVFARLRGFESFARDQLAIVPGRAERLDFQMNLHPICECVGPPSTVASLWKDADAVVRLRITGHAPGPAEVAGRLPASIAHTAAVVSVLKPHRRAASGAATLTFLQLAGPVYAEQEPYAIGQEFVIFLRWQSPQNTFIRLDANLGGAAAFAIENGRIHSAGIDGYAGRTVADLLSELQTLVRP